MNHYNYDPKELEKFAKAMNWDYKIFEENFPGQKAKVITSIAMFYDLDEPNLFVSDIVKCLHPEGLWIL